jgi:transcription elongation factor Elf1
MNCPFCNDPIRFQKIKDSKRYEWFSCGNCGCKRRKKKERLEDLVEIKNQEILL